MRTSSLLSFATVALVAFTLSETAHACEAPLCWSALVTPTSGSSIPKSTSAIPFRGFGTTPTITSGGNAVPVTVVPDPRVPDWELLVPTSPLVPGSYTVEYDEPCPAPAQKIARTFTVTDGVAVTTTLGSLRGDSPVTGKTMFPIYGGGCLWEIRALTFDLVLDKTSNAAELLPLTRFEIKVDGARAALTNYGDAHLNKDGEVVVGQLVSACDARSDHSDSGPTLGDHFVSVSAHVAGAASDPPSVTAYIRFRCDGGFMNLPMDSDGGVLDSDGGPPDTGIGTTGDKGGVSDADSRSSANSDSGSGGCAMAPTPHASSAFAFAFLAVGFVGFARSRRDGRRCTRRQHRMT